MASEHLGNRCTIYLARQDRPGVEEVLQEMNVSSCPAWLGPARLEWSDSAGRRFRAERSPDAHAQACGCSEDANAA